MHVPVWHAKTEPLRRSGELRVIGITEEQHPDRCALWAQWQGIDWPILWDPFNLTRSAAVPVAMAVDEHGVVRSMRLDPRRFEEQFLEGFLAVDFPAVDAEPADPYPGLRRADCGAARLSLGADALLTPEHALARLLFYDQVHGRPLPAAQLADAVRGLEQAAASELATPAEHFRLGVAYRLRYDSAHHRPGDFQASIDEWLTALLAEPGQYIWRRRIQQWGPRLDKPYAFYDWVETAQGELRARGVEPHPVRVPLTGSEVAGRTNEIPAREESATHPDPGRKVPRDESLLVAIEGAAALHTGVAGARVREPAGTARVHVVLRPDAEREVHWTNDAGPTVVWVSVPEGWSVRRNLHTLERPEGAAASAEVRRLDFEVRPPAVTQGPPPEGPSAVRGVAFYYVCEGASGECLYLAQDFEVPIPVPAAGGR